MYNRLKALNIEDRFKVIEAKKIYPDFYKSTIEQVEGFNIDDDWCKKVSEVITEDELNSILK
jgi:hypothetical protein